MTNDRMARWLGPLALGFLVMLVLGFFVVAAPNSPGENASGAQVVTFYRNHAGRTYASIYLVGVGLALFAFFLSALRHVLRESNRMHSWLSTAAFVSGLVHIGGFGVAGVTNLTALLASQNNRPDLAAQMNFIDNQYNVPIVLGVFVMTLAVAGAILTAATLPHWLGWLSLALAGVALLGPIAFFSFLAFPIWTTILGFACGRGAPAHAAEPMTATPGPVARPRHRLIPRHHH